MKSRDRQVGGDHYLESGMQPWEVIDRVFPPMSAAGFYHGNALKYLIRAGHKGPYIEDIRKAHHYLEKLIEHLEHADK